MNFATFYKYFNNFLTKSFQILPTYHFVSQYPYWWQYELSEFIHNMIVGARSMTDSISEIVGKLDISQSIMQCVCLMESIIAHQDSAVNNHRSLMCDQQHLARTIISMFSARVTRYLSNRSAL